MMNISTISHNAERLIGKLIKGGSISAVVAKNWHEYLIPDCEQMLVDINQKIASSTAVNQTRFLSLSTALQAALADFLNYYPKPVSALITDVELERAITPHEKSKALFRDVLPAITLHYFPFSHNAAGRFYCVDPVTDIVYTAPATWLNKPNCRKAKTWDINKYLSH